MAFSAVNAVALKPLPIRDPGSVYFLQSQSGSWSYPDYRDLRDRVRGAEALIGYRIAMMNVGLTDSASIWWGYLATGNYFEGLGIEPAAGRFFTPAEDAQPGAAPIAVISYEAWQSRFNGRPSVVGSELLVNGLRFTVLGVAPKGFHGTEFQYRPELWVPISMQAQIEIGSSWLTSRETQNLMVDARLRSGVSRARGEAEFAAAVGQLNREFPNRNAKLTAKLTKPGLFGDAIGGPARAFVWGLFALGAMLMLAGCSNLAGLLLARGNDRAREIALRAALGAGKGRIARQFLTESLLLSIIGGTGGTFLAWAGTRLASARRLPTELPVQFDLTSDVRVFAFAFGAALLVGLLVGVAPARFASGLDLNQSLKSPLGIVIGRRRIHGRELLVVVQVALCVVLLQASLLSVRGLQRASTAAIGWNPSGIAMAATELGLARYSKPQVDAYHQRVVEAARRLPGVASATTARSLPLHLDQSSTTVYPLPARDPDSGTGASSFIVAPEYFKTLQIPLRGGRDFNDFDVTTSTPVAIVNKALAERLFDTTDVVGRQLREGRGGSPVLIVGVVEDGKYQALAEQRRGAIFQPQAQRSASSSMIIVRSSPPGSVSPEDLTRLIRDIDPALPIRSAATGEQLTALPLLPYRIAVAAFGLLGLICSGLLLSGLHAMVAYAVTRRQREIGIRVALGASRANVARVVLTRVAAIVGAGIAVGVVLASGTGPLISSLVLGVSPRDPVLLVTIAVGLGVITLASCAGPVRRSLTIDPLIALRDD